MKFEFAYEKLLEHRRTIEEIARKDYLLAKSRVDEAENSLRRMYDEIVQARDRAGRLEVQGGAQGPTLALIAEFIDGQKIRIERQRQEIRGLVMETERLHERLVEAAREHKTLQKLKERRWKEFRRSLKKKELKEIDEIVTTRFGALRKEGA